MDKRGRGKERESRFRNQITCRTKGVVSLLHRICCCSSCCFLVTLSASPLLLLISFAAPALVLLLSPWIQVSPSVCLLRRRERESSRSHLFSCIHWTACEVAARSHACHPLPLFSSHLHLSLSLSPSHLHTQVKTHSRLLMNGCDLVLAKRAD